MPQKSPVIELKHKLREALREKREVLGPAKAASLSRKICSRLCAMREFGSTKTVMFYMPIKNEADPQIAIGKSFSQNKRVALPAIQSGAIVPRYFTSGKLKKGKFGIPEPSHASKVPLSKLDLILVPGVAFDFHGGRIGYGKGYYDAFLKKVPGAIKVGLAYDFQVVAHFKKEPHDIFVDRIITEKRTIDCTKLRGKNCC